MPRTAKSSPAVPVAEICLYGTMDVGAGWLANIANGTKCGLYLGNGEPVRGRSMTEAVWLAVEAIREAGVSKGAVRVFMSGGQRCADVDLGGYVPCFGDLPWQPAPVYMVSAEAVAKELTGSAAETEATP